MHICNTYIRDIRTHTKYASHVHCGAHILNYHGSIHCLEINDPRDELLHFSAHHCDIAWRIGVGVTEGGYWAIPSLIGGPFLKVQSLICDNFGHKDISMCPHLE